MNILHLCLGNFFIDNYSYQENMLTKYHSLQGHAVTVIASLYSFDVNGKGSELNGPSRYINESGCIVIRLAYKWPKRWNRFFRHFTGLYKAIEESKPDIMFSHNLSYGDTVVVKHYLRDHPHVKLFADNHADYINSAKNWWSKNILHPVIWRFYAKQLEPYLTKCYGVTPMRCRFLKEMYHINDALVEYLPLGVDDELIPKDRKAIRQSLRMELGISSDDFVIFTGGKIDRLKNTHVIIDALTRINSPHIHLIICGVLTPSMAYLFEKITSIKQIHYLGWCDARRVMDCMVSSDMACFPGTHSTLWEQVVGVGLPAIFKRWPEMEHVNVYNNCIFVSGSDSLELGRAILKLSNPDLYQQFLSSAGLASHLFLYSVIAKKSIGL